MQPRLTLTPEEYFALDAAAPEGTRYEYFDGRIFAMAGASPDHNQIVANAITQLNLHLPETCRISGADQQTQINPRRTYVYPDVVVACEPEYDGVQLLNPVLLVEVLSESTEARDRNEKLDAYLGLDSVMEYWLVAQDQPRIAQYTRVPDGWHLHLLHGLDAEITSPHFSLTFALRDLYSRVF